MLLLLLLNQSMADDMQQNVACQPQTTHAKSNDNNCNVCSVMKTMFVATFAGGKLRL